MRIIVRLYFLFFCFPFFYASQAQVAGTFTINSAQPTGGSNFQTFTDAVNSLANGVSGPVVFNVTANSGPYNERIFLDHKIHTTATNTVTFNCNGVTLTFLSKGTDQRAGVLLDSADYVTFDSLVVIPQGGQNSDEYGYGFHLLHDADHNTIRKCTILNSSNAYDPLGNDNIIINGVNTYGMDDGTSSCDSNLITRNMISGGFAGVTLSSRPASGQQESWMSGNQVTYNTITNVDFFGVLLNGYSEGTLVEGNDITAPNATWTRGIALFLSNEQCTIRDNRIHNFINLWGTSLTGILIASTASAGKEIVVANNLIYDFHSVEEQDGIVLGSESPCANVKILHNTIVQDDNTPGAFATYGIKLGFFTSNVQVLNNIVSITRSPVEQAYGIYLEEPVPGLVSDRNDWHIASAGASINAVGLTNGEPVYTLSDWQTAMGLDLHSAAVDPLFTDAAGGNFKPAQAAIDNLGSYEHIDTDITGLARSSTTPDPGAFEFTGGACTVPVAGTTTVYPAVTTCENQPVTLSLSGHSFGTGQTFQWQSDTGANGSFSTLVGSAQASPGLDINATATLYYRAAVTCGTTTVFSDPVKITVEPALAAGTYTIDPAKPADGANFPSFSDAISAMHCGIRGPVVFDVAPGNYPQQVIIPEIAGLSATKTVTFKGNGATLSFTSTDPNDKAVIKLNGADYITIDSFNIEVPGSAAGEYGFGVQLIDDADHNTISNCTITLNKTSDLTDYAGIVISPVKDEAASRFYGNYCDSNTITGNTITGGYYGITCTSYDGENLPSGNIIAHNHIVDEHGYGIYLAGTKNTLIEANDITRPTRAASAGLYVAIYMFTHNEGVAISKNKIHLLANKNTNATVQLLGIYTDNSKATASAPNIVSNNLLYDFGGNGLVNGIYYINADHTKFYHNTISLDDSTANTNQATRGFSVLGSYGVGLEFLNNNITIKRTGTGPKHCFYISPSSLVYRSDYNNFYVAGSPAYIGHKGSFDYATLGNWQTASGQDAHSISVDPVYKNPAAVDFTPTVLAFNNKGIYAGIDTDIDDRSRSNTQPDIGAIEFFMCTVFPEVQVAADSQTVCTNAPVTFTVIHPEANTTYSWYTSSTKGSSFNTGTSYSVNNVTSPLEYWIEGVTSEGCASIERTRVKVKNLAPLAQAPVPVTDTATVNMIRFKWDAVPGASTYQVSRDGVHFSTPTSGAAGLTHTITGLTASDTVSLVVKALAVLDCQSIVSARVAGRTLSNQFFIPNTFTPNGNGQNDVFKVYSNLTQSLHLMVFNQWGEKVFETTNPQGGWDGTYKGRQQPAGVYIYVAKLTLTDGTAVNQKGTLNLIR